ncbi:hypothetical protein L596_029124 [Steinernema carpocapsae]|uniref:Uncharacterized protein n=1 Tax=Steinernema carpocapsae TaxID=34508 RepID=A0A4U5LTQ0_STECR|nr:hypothetical protein L596_029124 [Steinernema carpocapsae]
MNLIYRYVVLFVSLLYLTLLIAHSAVFNFTVICMKENEAVDEANDQREPGAFDLGTKCAVWGDRSWAHSRVIASCETHGNLWFQSELCLFRYSVCRWDRVSSSS